MNRKANSQDVRIGNMLSGILDTGAAFFEVSIPGRNNLHNVGYRASQKEGHGLDAYENWQATQHVNKN